MGVGNPQPASRGVGGPDGFQPARRAGGRQDHGDRATERDREARGRDLLRLGRCRPEAGPDERRADEEQGRSDCLTQDIPTRGQRGGREGEQRQARNMGAGRAACRQSQPEAAEPDGRTGRSDQGLRRPADPAADRCGRAAQPDVHEADREQGSGEPDQDRERVRQGIGDERRAQKRYQQPELGRPDVTPGHREEPTADRDHRGHEGHDRHHSRPPSGVVMGPRSRAPDVSGSE